MALGIDFDKLRSELKEENRQRYSGLDEYQRPIEQVQAQQDEYGLSDIVINTFSHAFQGDIDAMIGSLILIACASLPVFCLYKRRNFSMKKLTSLRISQIVLIIFLFVIATHSYWRISGGVYTLLRILTTVISIWSATKTNNNILRLVFAFIAILFNPIVLVELGRDEWETIDFTVAIFYLGIVLHSLFIKPKQE